MQSLGLLPDWTASVQNQVACSAETWISPSDTFWKPQGTSGQFASTGNSHTVLPETATTCSHYCTKQPWGHKLAGRKLLKARYEKAPARHLSLPGILTLRAVWPSSQIKAVLDAFLSGFNFFAVFSHYTICISDKRTTKSFALFLYIMVKHLDTKILPLQTWILLIMLKCMQCFRGFG